MAFKKGRDVITNERNKKIKDMDIEEVKKYLCMKNYQNPDKCPECAGLETCSAGQRVVELKEMQKAKEAEDAEWKARRTESIAEANAIRTKRAKEYIKTVLASEDPRAYLMQHEGLTYMKAGKKLTNWRANHPELFEGVTWKKHHNGINRYTKKHEEEKPVEHPAEESKEEISIEEFLNGAGETVPEEPAAKAVEEPKPEHNPCGVPYKLLDTQNHIAEEMNKVSAEIKRLQEYYNTLKRANDAVSMTISLIDMKITDKSMDKLLKYYK